MDKVSNTRHNNGIDSTGRLLLLLLFTGHHNNIIMYSDFLRGYEYCILRVINVM